MTRSRIVAGLIGIVSALAIGATACAHNRPAQHAQPGVSEERLVEAKITVKTIDLSQMVLSTPAIAEELAGQFLEASRSRVEAGLGSDGSEMPPKRDGSVRTLDKTGEMLDTRKITESTESSVTIGWDDPAQADIASQNEDKTPWVKPTSREGEEIVTLAGNLVRDQVQREQDRIRGEKA